MGQQYKFYIDDSGTKEYDPARLYARGVTRYFCFGGLLMPVPQAQIADRLMREVKKACFGTSDVEIKSNWLRMPLEREKRFLTPYGITEQTLTGLVDNVYGIISELECVLIACVVDKLAMQERYPSPYYAPAVAYESIMQRAQLQMEEVEGQVSVTVDAMTGATPHGNQYHENLLRHHKRMRTYGSPLQRGVQFTRLNELSFAGSHKDERIQLADIVAYNAYRQFVSHGGQVDDVAVRYPHFARLAPKFRHYRGKIAGFGVIAFPKQ